MMTHRSMQVRLLQCRLVSATSARESRAPVSALLRLHHLVCARHRHPPLTTAAPLGGAPLLPIGPPSRAFCQYSECGLGLAC